MCWSFDGGQLDVFSMDGKHWTFTVTEKGLVMDEVATMYINRILQIKCQKQADAEKDNDEKDDHNDDDVVSQEPISKTPKYFGADGSANAIFFAIVFS